VEFLVRETSEDNDRHMNDIYDTALIRGVSRQDEIMQAMAAFGGD